MKLSALLERIEYTCCQGSIDQEIGTVVYDSRKAGEDSLFICIRGAVADGHKFIPDVLKKGCKSPCCGGRSRSAEGRYGDPCKRHTIRYGLYFSSVFRISGGAA